MMTIAALVATFSATATELPVTPRFGMKLGFGANATAVPAFTLAADTPIRFAAEAPLPIVQFDVRGGFGELRLAGVPLWLNRYSLGQAEDVGDSPAGSGSKPWYARQWIWWTAGGIAAAAALTGLGDEKTICTGTCNQNNTGGGESGTTVNVLSPDPEQTCATKGIDPLPDTCVDDPGLAGGIVDVRFAATTDASWLDSGSGHMGDLIALPPE
jgi:hypothetical protein